MVDFTHAWVSDPRIPESCHPAMERSSHRWVSSPLAKPISRTMPNSDGKLYPSLFKPWSNIITRQNALTQRWEALPIDGNPAMGRLNHRWEGMTVNRGFSILTQRMEFKIDQERIAILTVQESQYVISSADCSIGECVLACSVGHQGAVASTVFTNGGLVRGFIPGYIATRRVYGPTYGVEHTVSSNYYKYFEMNHAVEAFIVLPGGVDTMEGLFTLISWASEGLHNRPIGLLNIDGYFNNLLKFLDGAVRQNFMASSQRKLFISSFSVDELLEKLEFAKAFPGPGVSYDEFVNPGRLDLELHL
ncbi:hypothetical protein DM860_014758 [Cuscuta australis]|uniref:cytokinin riboside 5'-monophosphate phosphoribohydrolase n=1 Tax=Cuscuta australis TaxID=267555 RepID=A0A328CZM7_9ASTE|nr:hypothetical protein DM860_014758 [Cuscuta australis]